MGPRLIPVVLVALAVLSAACNASTDEPSEAAAANIGPIATVHVATPNPATLGPGEHIKALIGDQYQGQNNRDMAKLRSVSVKKSGKQLVVDVAFNAEDNLSMGFIKGGIENEMQETFKRVYNSGEAIKSVTVTAYFTLVDAKGNESEEPVYETVLTAADAKDINWENAAIIDWNNVWKVEMIQNELKEAD